jgi:hypothetical protein
MGNQIPVDVSTNTFIKTLCSKEPLTSDEWKASKESINELTLSLPLSLMETQSLDTVFHSISKELCNFM